MRCATTELPLVTRLAYGGRPMHNVPSLSSNALQSGPAQGRERCIACFTEVFWMLLWMLSAVFKTSANTKQP